MLWTICAILIVLWLLGAFVANVGSLVHLLLLLALVVIVVQLVGGGGGSGWRRGPDV